MNKDDKNMIFGLGGHPAFACEYASGKYRIDFQDVESDIEVYQLEDGLVKLEPEKTKKYIKENRIFLDNHTFQKDAVIMKNIKSDRVYLKTESKLYVPSGCFAIPLKIGECISRSPIAPIVAVYTIGSGTGGSVSIIVGSITIGSSGSLRIASVFCGIVVFSSFVIFVDFCVQPETMINIDNSKNKQIKIKDLLYLVSFKYFPFFIKTSTYENIPLPKQGNI